MDTSTGAASPRTRLGRNYWRLWTASVISNLGDGVAIVAYPWLASAVTRSPLHLAGITAATRIAWLVVTLPAGVITDRVDRRTLIGTMDAVRFLITAFVAIVVFGSADELPSPGAIAAGTATPPGNATVLLVMLYVAALLFGTAEVLRDNAAQTLMPAVVDKSALEKANGRLWGAEMVANQFVGPPLGGFLLAVGFALPFFLDAGTFLVAAVLIFTLSGSFRARESAPEPIRWKAEIGEGVRWLWRNRLLRVMGIILGAMNAMLMMVFATYVLFVQEILDLGETGFGFVMTGGAVGGVLGSLAASKISQRLGAGVSLNLTLYGSAVLLALTGLTSSGVVVWVLVALMTFLGVLWNVITVSFRQSIIPDHLLGRVNSVYRLFAWGAMPVGSALGGIIVWAAESSAGRELALRFPFFVAAAVFIVLSLFGRTTLTSANLERARSDAEAEVEG